MKLKVITPGKMVVVKGKPIRTPVTIDPSDETELEFFEAVCRAQSLEYELIDESNEKSETPSVVIDKENESPVIEELKTGRLLDELTK